MNYYDLFPHFRDGEVNLPRAVKHLVVSLRRVDDSLSKSPLVLDAERLIECSGCSLYLGNEDKCAQHLLQECLLPKNQINGEEFRSKLTKWLFKYFLNHFMKSSANET